MARLVADFCTLSKVHKRGAHNMHWSLGVLAERAASRRRGLLMIRNPSDPASGGVSHGPI